MGDHGVALVLLALGAAWVLWTWFVSLSPLWRAAVVAGVGWSAWQVVADHATPAAVAGAVAAVAGWAWMCALSRTGTGSSAAGGGAGMCGACGRYSADVAAHEAGHVVAARQLGYRVPGALVRRDGSGFTRIPDLGDGWDRMVISAAGASGENRDRLIFDAGINGTRHDKWSDAWWVHRIAPRIAAERGLTTTEVIRQARAEADSRVNTSAREWRQVRDALARDGQVGEVPE